MRAEHKRLEDEAEAEWREMKTALASLSERTSALDVLATQIDDLCSVAQQCSSQWTHEKMRVDASVMQIRELSTALCSDSNEKGGGGAGRGGRMKKCRTPPTDRGRLGGCTGGGRRTGVSARRTMNAALEGSMQVLPGDDGKPGGGGGGGGSGGSGGGGGGAFERASLLDKVHQLQEIRREHESRLSALREEERHAEAAVEQSAKFVGDVLALGREERQVCPSSRA